MTAKFTIAQIMASIIILFCSSLNASVFSLSEEVIGVPNLKTECITSSSQSDDYCKTQIAYQFTLYSGGTFGQLSLAKWGGTDEYSASSGTCKLEFNGEYVDGSRDYIPDSNFTACYFRDENALAVLIGMLDETRFNFYTPTFKGKNHNHSYYTSDISLGWLTDKSITPEIVLGGFIHHTAISSKRTQFKNAYYGHPTLAKASPWKFGKILSKFKYHDLIK